MRRGLSSPTLRRRDLGWKKTIDHTHSFPGNSVHVSPLLKLTIVLRRAIRGTPPLHRWVLVPPFSELREPILLRFFLKNSSEVVAIARLFFGGFVTAWSFDPERFRQTRWIYIWCPKLFLVMMFWSDCYKK